MEDKAYLNSIHRLGRISSVIALLVMLGIPTIICIRYHCFPELTLMLQPLIVISVAIAPGSISEVFSYGPTLGSSSYMAFITGNILNLKLPVAMAAQGIAKAEPNTTKADAVATLSIALSSIETIAIVFLGVLLMAPLQPVLQTAAFQTAAKYIVPALFGGMALNSLVLSGKKKHMDRKWLVSALPVVVTLVGFFTITKFSSYKGYFILALIPLTIAWAYLLHKKGIVKITDRTAKQ